MKLDRMPARFRLFRIWQVLGRNPFKAKVDTSFEPIECPSCGHVVSTPYCPNCGQPYAKKGHSFFHGSLDSIPFLNDDARRTLVHLVLRPGYMIRDYMNGMTSRYMAPLTCLIIFYAFFAIMTNVLSPEFNTYQSVEDDQEEVSERGLVVDEDEIEIDDDDDISVHGIKDMLVFIKKVNDYAHLDQRPELVDTKTKASVAGIEGALRSQGIFSFLWQLIFLTLAMKVVFRKEPSKLSFSASATFASYVLCQMCFLMMFILLTSFGRTHRLGAAIIAIIMVIDFVQFFNIERRQALKYALRVGIQYYLLMALAIAVTAVVLALAFFEF